jgi:mRNA interferase RelE/StbE
MSYKLLFHVNAEKEWRKIGATVRAQFNKKLAERLQQPHVPASRLRGDKDRYKIKLRKSGYRLVYQVRDREILVMVLAVGKRERGDIYEKAGER